MGARSITQAINGHAFGAGMMFALAHDRRLQRQERGYQCAVEVAIGIRTPSPELTLFRHSMSANAFYETCVLGRRWSGDDAAQAGVVSQSVPGALLLEAALKEATQLSKLGANRGVMQYYKQQTKGFVADEILAWEFADGHAKGSVPLPAGLQKHVDDLAQPTPTWGQRCVSKRALRWTRPCTMSCNSDVSTAPCTICCNIMCCRCAPFLSWMLTSARERPAVFTVYFPLSCVTAGCFHCLLSVIVRKRATSSKQLSCFITPSFYLCNCPSLYDRYRDFENARQQRRRFGSKL